MAHEQDDKKALEAIVDDFRTKRPVPWDRLPDLALYMDQVIAYLGRTRMGLSQTQKLTAAMVNNYVKEGLLPRARGKRYEREHLAYLEFFVALKDVLSVKEAGHVLNACMGQGPVDIQYERLRQTLSVALDGAEQRLPQSLARDELIEAAMALALESYACKHACQRLIDVLMSCSDDTHKVKKGST